MAGLNAAASFHSRRELCFEAQFDVFILPPKQWGRGYGAETRFLGRIENDSRLACRPVGRVCGQRQGLLGARSTSAAAAARTYVNPF